MFLDIHEKKKWFYLWGKYGDGGATSDGLGSPLRNFCVRSCSAFALTDRKRLRKLLLLPHPGWIAPFCDSIGTRSSVGVDGVDVPVALPRPSWCTLDVNSEIRTLLWDEVAAPILQILRRNKAEKLLGDVGDADVVVVAAFDDDAPPDSEKYDGLSVNICIERIQVTTLTHALNIFFFGRLRRIIESLLWCDLRTCCYSERYVKVNRRWKKHEMVYILMRCLPLAYN